MSKSILISVPISAGPHVPGESGNDLAPHLGNDWAPHLGNYVGGVQITIVTQLRCNWGIENGLGDRGPL